MEEGGFLPSITSQFADTGDAGPSADATGGILNLSRSADHPFPLRIDTQAPTGGEIQIVEFNGNRENWVNAEYDFSAGATAPIDGGVGGVETEIEILDDGEVISEDDLENSVTNTRYSLRLLAEDALGNSTSISQTGSGGSASGAAAQSHTLTTFGYDDDAPDFDVTFLWDEDEADSGEQFVAQAFAADAGVAIEATDVVSGFAPSATGESLEHNLIRVTPVAQDPEGFNRTILVGSATTASTTPFADTEADAGFVAGGAGITAYTRTPTSMEWDFAFGGLEGAIDPAGYYIYQVQAQDKAGNRTDFGWFMAYINEENDPELTGLSPASFYPAGEPATFEAVSQDAVEVTEASMDLRYANVGRLVYDRNPEDPIGEKFTDFLEIPNQFQYSLDAFIPGIQLTDEFGRPEGDSNQPNQVTGRVYNGFGSYQDDPAATHMMDDVAGDGVSEFFSVPLLSSTLEAGSTFPAGSVAADGSQVIGPTDVEDDAPVGPAGSYGFIIPDDGEVLVRGVTAQFTNPFETVIVVARFEGETGDLDDDFLVLVDTAEPEFDAPFPTRDNGVIRDYTWTFDPGDFEGQDGFLGFHAVGIDSGWSALATPLFGEDDDPVLVLPPNGA
ncbi:MAG: hypothetical protein EA352_05565 [Gemmatimonadales bacterium]|nr:MAG: hypothetical protein EA352_05565 [Gemmatimonadales bacterium]